MFFWDTFKATYTAEQVSEVILVDHNILDVTESDLGPKVTRIIDHHVDQHAYAE